MEDGISIFGGRPKSTVFLSKSIGQWKFGAPPKWQFHPPPLHSPISCLLKLCRWVGISEKAGLPKAPARQGQGSKHLLFARPGFARPGLARPCHARLGLARRSQARPGEAKTAGSLVTRHARFATPMPKPRLPKLAWLKAATLHPVIRNRSAYADGLARENSKLQT